MKKILVRQILESGKETLISYSENQLLKLDLNTH